MKAKNRKCIVMDCVNHANHGVFVRDLCFPCHEFIVSGKGVHSQAYRNAKQMTEVFLGEMLHDFLAYFDDIMKERKF